MNQAVLVVSGRHAGGQAVASLRLNEFDGRTVLVGAEPVSPYHRPP
ncbi:hypothetical protein [Mycolicibacterium doricum]|jgi:3-phenylpropionate/trans-cinnamate dioxygenase ferredoxin reductase subunit|nr:hypothetical protein [Mycolicibacterium doricum]MCV7267133.1 hypothetical protein [Mycolicibacterium doricum]